MNTAANWSEKQIGAHLKLLSGFPFPSGRFSNSEGFPLIRIRDILDSKVETYFTGPFIPTYVIKKGDILIGMDGDFNIVKWQNQDALLNQRILKVEVSDSKQLDIGFIYYWLQPFIRKVNDMTAATTVKHLSTKDLLRAKGKIPGVSAQHKIAQILQTIDQSIEKTEALIEKYQQIKAGLMHDLFTRGIGADGELRPPRDQAPELYQETPIGWIPKEWQLGILDDSIRIIDCKHVTPTYCTEGYPIIRPRNVNDDGLDFDNVDYISEANYRLLTDVHTPRKGDIVYSRNASFGIPCFVETDRKFAIGQDIAIMTKSTMDTKYVYYVLKSNLIWTQISRQFAGSTFGRINLGDIRKFVIPKPIAGEQEEISIQLGSLDAKISTEIENKNKLLKQKSGLMHDLLTGKVEVKAD